MLSSGEYDFMSQLTPELSRVGPATQDNLRLPAKLKVPTGVGSSDYVRHQIHIVMLKLSVSPK
jgi:hypothetical protein